MPYRRTATREPLPRSAAQAGLVLALAALLPFGATGCADDPRADDSAGTSVDSRPLEVRSGTLRPRLLLTGELQAVRAERIVVPRTPSWRLPIRWMEADGAQVRAGDRVLELDNTQFTGELEQKRLAVSSALNELMRRQAEIARDLEDKAFAVDKARVELEKARIQASVPQDLLAARDYQERQLALARAGVQHDKAEEELDSGRRSAEASIEELRIALERARDEVRIAEEAIAELTLFAPRDGILVVAHNRQEGRKFQTGDNVWVGLAVMSVPELSEMKVEADLMDVDDGRIAVGSPTRCVLDAYPGRSFAGVVSEITPIAQEIAWNSLRRAFRATIRLDEVDPERMRPGMSVKVEVLAPPLEDVLVAPRAGLDLASTPPLARLADGRDVEVRLGRCTADRCVVEEGLAPGDRLRPPA